VVARLNNERLISKLLEKMRSGGAGMRYFGR
jgi:hypothetical protein